MITNRFDTIELILKHAIQQGSYSKLYVDRLYGMNDAELNMELERIEEIAVYGFADVGGMTYDEVRFSSRGD
jgi:CTP:phosphocholine cytidylyltransferase-like protein